MASHTPVITANVLHEAYCRALIQKGVDQGPIGAATLPEVEPLKADTNALRVLQWNILADGLSNDGFLMEDVLLPEEGEEKFDVVQLANQAVKARAELDMSRLAKFSTPRSKRNTDVMVSWDTRWLRMRALIAQMDPDIIAFQEMDHTADAQRDLRALGYECSLPKKDDGYHDYNAYARQRNVKKPDPRAYLRALKEQGVAFAPKVPSNCKKFAEKRNLPAPDDDGCLILWKREKFDVVRLKFLNFVDEKRSEGCVRVQLRRKTDGAPLFVICAHCHSGDKTTDETKRVSQLLNPTFRFDGTTGRSSLLQFLEKSAKLAPTILCMDANSDPHRREESTVWKTIRQTPNVRSVWDNFIDERGLNKNAEDGAYPVTTNKMRGPDSDQPKKIGEHACMLSDHIFFTDGKSLRFLRHGLPPLIISRPSDALQSLIPNLSIPSDHYPVLCDFSLEKNPTRGMDGPSSESFLNTCVQRDQAVQISEAEYVEHVGASIENSMSNALRHVISNRSREPVSDVATSMLMQHAEQKSHLREVVKEFQIQSGQEPEDTEKGCEDEADDSETEEQRQKEWTLVEWLKLCNLHKEISTAMKAFLANEGVRGDRQTFIFLQHLAREGKEDQIRSAFEAMLCQDTIKFIADALTHNVLELARQQASNASSLNSKFATDDTTYELAFGGKSDFQKGLDGLVGPPQPNVQSSMKNEHCSSPDSKIYFQPPNYPTTTRSSIEYWFVVSPDDEGKKECQVKDWPKENFGAEELRNHHREAVSLEDLAKKRRQINHELHRHDFTPLQDLEFFGARLYTGPMYIKYNTVLRALGNGPSNRHLWKKFDELCKGNPYCTTIHTINSAILKLSNLQRACKVYRGISGASLPHQFWEKDAFGLRCAVDYSFMSTTADRDVARGYASSGRSCILLEFDQGMVSRGADLSWLSQYPHEQEILFPPLCGLEVIGERVEGSSIVIELRVACNMGGLPIEESTSQMRRSHLQLIEMIKNSIKFTGLPTNMLDRFDQMRLEAVSRDADFFNNAENFLDQTKALLQLRRELFDDACDPQSWDRHNESIIKVAAHLAAEGEYESSLKMLRIMIDLDTRSPSSDENLKLVRDAVNDLPVEGALTPSEEQDLKLAAFLISSKHLKSPWNRAFVHLSTKVKTNDKLRSLFRSLYNRNEIPVAHLSQTLYCNKDATLHHVSDDGKLRFSETPPPGLDAKDHAYWSVLPCQSDLHWLFLEAARMEDEPLVRDLLSMGEEYVRVCDDAKQTALHKAAKVGHVSICKFLVDHNANFKLLDAQGNRPYDLAVEGSHHQCIRALIPTELHKDLQQCALAISNKLKQTTAEGFRDVVHLFQKACGHANDPDKFDREFARDDGTAEEFRDVVYLFQKACRHANDPDMFDREFPHDEVNGARLLMIAAFSADIDITRELLSRKDASDLLQQRSFSEATPLMWAVEGLLCANLAKPKQALEHEHVQHMQVIQELLQKDGFGVNNMDCKGMNVLSMAAIEDAEDAVKLLLEHRAEFGLPSAEAGLPNKEKKAKRTALHWAAASGSIRTVRLLVESKADANMKELKHGRCPLSLACFHGHLEVVAFLIKQKVDVNSTDKDGSTPFLLASSRGQDEVIRILKRNGARSSDVDNNGLTALMLACANGFECAVRTLLSFENQAEVLELSSLAGVTPLMLASKNGHKSIVQILIDANAELDKEYAYDEKGKHTTALGLAQKYGHTAVARILRRAGAHDLSA